MKRSPMPPRRKPLVGKKWEPPRRPLPRVSKKRRRELRVRAQVRAEVLERDGGCVARLLLPLVACGGELHVHEPRRRSQDSTAWLDPAKAITLCALHHAWAHDNVADAVAVGLLVHGEAA